MKTITINKSYCSDYCDWQDEILVHIDEELVSKMKECRKLLEEHPYIRGIKIEVPSSFLDDESYNQLNETCRVGTEYIELSKHFVCYSLCSKYDCSYEAEYCLSAIA